MTISITKPAPDQAPTAPQGVVYAFSRRQLDKAGNVKNNPVMSLTLAPAVKIPDLDIEGSIIPKGKVLAVRHFLKGTTECPPHTTEYAGVDCKSPSMIIKQGETFYAIPYNAAFQQQKAPRGDSVANGKTLTWSVKDYMDNHKTYKGKPAAGEKRESIPAPITEWSAYMLDCVLAKISQHIALSKNDLMIDFEGVNVPESDLDVIATTIECLQPEGMKIDINIGKVL